jgi:hypothetical protein
VIGEIVALLRLGYRFIALADDNFYPVTLTDIELAEKQDNAARVAELRAIRAERLELMDKRSFHAPWSSSRKSRWKPAKTRSS